MSDAPIIRIVGKSGSGKTTLIEKLIPALKGCGLRVGTIKHHAHPDFEIDQAGKDSWRHYEAGADAVMIASPVKMAAVHRLVQPLSLAELAAGLSAVDIILVDGFGRDNTTPKIEVVRAARSAQPLNPPGDVLAYVTDVPLDGAPCFGLDDVEALTGWLLAHLLIECSPSSDSLSPDH